MGKLYDWWKGLVGEDADPKKMQNVYIALAVFGVLVLIFTL